ncbi:MAG: ABC transporter permease [Mesorhizobium sp.]|nr:MAG: ABC transporter permease [Mesorhizobium sp.]
MAQEANALENQVQPRNLIFKLRRSRESMAVSILILDVLLVLVFGAVTGGIMLQTSALQALAVNSAETILLACGAAIVLGLGEIDISLGAVLIAASVIGGNLVIALPAGTSAPLAILAGLVACAVTGMACTAISAFCLLFLRVNSFITTLGMLGILTGFVFVVTGGTNLVGLPTAIQDGFGSVVILSVIPLPALLSLLAAAVVWFVLNKTRFGVHVLAAGSSRSATVRAGVNITLTIFLTYLIVGLLAGLAGFIDISRFATTDVSGHQTDALAGIAGAVIGGTRLTGGRVSILGAVAGALLASILQIGLVVAGFQAFYQLIAIGFILLAAVAISQRQLTANDR